MEFFSDLALLHLGGFLMDNFKSVSWKKRAITRINKLLKIAYYDDFINNNTVLYTLEIIILCLNLPSNSMII